MKKGLALLLALMVGGAALTGCGNAGKDKKNVSEVLYGGEAGIRPVTAEDVSHNAAQVDSQGELNCLKRLYSLTEKNTMLEKAIVDYYEIPDEFLEDTRYFYNYVDLDGDGKNEIAAVATGSYVGGSGGISVLLVSDDYKVMQVISAADTPVIVEDRTVNGYKPLLIRKSGGTAQPEYISIIYENGEYVPAGPDEAVTDVTGIKGTALICDSLARESGASELLSGISLK